MLSTEIGRLSGDEVGGEHIFDDPTKAYSALLTKVDEIIDVLAGITTNEVATLTNDIVFEASNSIAITLDGVAIASTPVVYATSNANTQSLIVAALEAELLVTSVDITSDKVLTVTYADFVPHVIAFVTTGGSNQAVTTHAITTEAGTSSTVNAVEKLKFRF